MSLVPRNVILFIVTFHKQAANVQWCFENNLFVSNARMSIKNKNKLMKNVTMNYKRSGGTQRPFLLELYAVRLVK